jgi:hypothetical protein
MALPPVLDSIVSWLRAGYPQGVPDSDYIPLIAILSRRLTTDEVAAVATELARQVPPPADGESANGHQDGTAVNGQGSTSTGHWAASRGLVDNGDIGVMITKITNEMPRDEDIDRVRSQLASAGPFL